MATPGRLFSFLAWRLVLMYFVFSTNTLRIRVRTRLYPASGYDMLPNGDDMERSGARPAVGCVWKEVCRAESVLGRNPYVVASNTVAASVFNLSVRLCATQGRAAVW